MAAEADVTYEVEADCCALRPILGVFSLQDTFVLHVKPLERRLVKHFVIHGELSSEGRDGLQVHVLN